MKLKLPFILLLISVFAHAQEDAWVYFNAKPNAAFYLSNPLQMLTQRSLDRRALQNIPLDFKDVPVHQPFIDQITTSQGITVMAKSKWLNALHIRGSIVNINALASLSFVSQVKFANKNLNPSGRNGNFSKKNDFNKNEEVQISYNYGGSNNQIQMLNGNLLHQQNFTGLGKIIAILDAGFPGVNTIAPFAKIRNNNQILGGYNYVDRSTNFYTANSHGTLVLSTIAGFTDNQLIGTAPDASFYLFVTEDAVTENPVEESLWVEAAEEADRLGVDVINTSLGYFDYDNANYSHTYSEMNGTTTFIARGANIAFSRGMMVVVSAGNSGNSANPNIATPADATNVLTVGAVDFNGNYASFSSIGPSFDGRVKPDVMAKGLGATVSNTQGNITTANGTSFSSPIIAGMVACLWQALPTKTNAQLMQIIKSSSNNFSTPNANYGYGIPNFASAVSNNLSVDNFDSSEFLAYPNPTANEVYFQFNANWNNANLKIYNTLGQLILNEDSLKNDSKISLSNQPNGFYYYKILVGSELKSGKILKQ